MAEVRVRAVDSSWKKSMGGPTYRSQVLVGLIVKGRSWPLWSWTYKDGAVSYWNPTLAERIAEAQRP